MYRGERKQSDTTYGLFFNLIASSDHLTGLTGKSGSVVVGLTKNGGANAVPSGAISEVDATNHPGLYKIAGNATDSNTLGSLHIYAKDAASDPCDEEYKIVNYDPFTFLPDVNVSKISGAAVSTVTAQIGVNAVNVGGTAQTGRDLGASVLLSSGTGTGQLDFTSGVVKANLAQILGTALTETAGYLAAAFKKFFNIATPASTMDSLTLVTTATNLTNAPGAGDFTAAMKASLNAATPIFAVALKKNTALAKFPFPMRDSTTHLPVTGKTVTCVRKIDSGAFAAGTLANVAEISDGLYSVDFGAGDLNGAVITLKATAAGCDTTLITLVTAQ